MKFTRRKQWHVPSSSFPGHFPAASAALFCCMACCSANLSPTLWVILTYLSPQFSTRSTEGVSFQAGHVRCLVGKDTRLALVLLTDAWRLVFIKGLGPERIHATVETPLDQSVVHSAERVQRGFSVRHRAESITICAAASPTHVRLSFVCISSIVFINSPCR